MARVTQSEVKKIIDTDLDVDAFITVANLVVTDRLTGKGLSDALMKEIERWLSAHFVAIREMEVQKEKLGEGEVTYQKKELGKELDSTSYGQQVKILDSTGTLASAGGKVFSLEVVRGN